MKVSGSHQGSEARGSCVVYVGHDRRIETVADRLLEEQEAVLHVMG